MTEREFYMFFDYTINTETNTCHIHSLTFIGRIQENLILPSHFRGLQVYLPDDCDYLFALCRAKTIDLSNIIDTSNVTNISKTVNINKSKSSTSFFS